MSRRPTERTLDAQILGRRVRFDYSETWVAWSVLWLRILMAWTLLQAGIGKATQGGIGEFLSNPIYGGWDGAEAYLRFGTADSPAYFLFEAMADLTWLIDPLVMWGQILVGIGLLLGVLFRFSALMGSLMMILFWLGGIQGGLLEGLPVEHGFVVNSELVYVFILFGLGAVGAGRILGLDAQIEEWPVVEQNPWLTYFLG